MFTLLVAEQIKQKEDFVFHGELFLWKRPQWNTTFISTVNDSLSVNNRSCSNYFFDMQLNLNSPRAE